MTQTVAKICNSDSNYSTRYAEGETKVDSEEVEGVVDLEINERSKNVIGVRDIKMISDTGNNKVEKVDSPSLRSAKANTRGVRMKIKAYENAIKENTTVNRSEVRISPN